MYFSFIYKSAIITAAFSTTHLMKQVLLNGRHRFVRDFITIFEQTHAEKTPLKSLQPLNYGVIQLLPWGCISISVYCIAAFTLGLNLFYIYYWVLAMSLKL